MIDLVPFVLGPLENNSFVLKNDASFEAFIVDPSFDPAPIARYIGDNHLNVKAILLTHAHFDHIAGIPYLVSILPPPLGIFLAAADEPLYFQAGGAEKFGLHIGELPPVTRYLRQGEKLQLGGDEIDVRAVPGHTPGHVMFYVPSIEAALCGDLIFKQSIGRTDLPGGDFDTIIASIRSQVLTLPIDTTLYPGHGPETTVADEMTHNPFLI